MTNHYRIVVASILLLLVATSCRSTTPDNSIPPPEREPEEDSPQVQVEGFPFTIPQGSSLSVFAQGLKNPRVMVIDNTGALVTSITSEGKVVALIDRDGNGVSDETFTVIEKLKKPHGLAFGQCSGISSNFTAEKPPLCDLYIAETHQVGLYDYNLQTKKAMFKKKIVDLPNGGQHFTRTIALMTAPNEPDRLLISVGSSCNVCEEKDERRASIMIVNIDGTNVKTYASGLRNAVFMRFHPVTGKLWVTEMGRDNLGDDLPPDEINIVEEEKNYGWPFCYGKNVQDPAFADRQYLRNPCLEPYETPSYIDIEAHSAPLGLAFIPEEGWPKEYWYNLLVAFHGSWNRSEPTGYKVVRYRLDADGKFVGKVSRDGRPIPEDFMSGWLGKDGKAIGRPADVLVLPGGEVFISDDKAGVIYRLNMNQKPQGQPRGQNSNDKSNLIKVSQPQESEVIQSPLEISGEARGFWYFEGTFPISLYDANNNLIVQALAQAETEWTTDNFVSFKTILEFKTPETETGLLVFKKDNPSGLPQYEDEFQVRVRFKPDGGTSTDCIKTGCSGQFCSDSSVTSTCEYKDEYACYKSAICARQADGKCGFTMTDELAACLKNPPKTE